MAIQCKKLVQLFLLLSAVLIASSAFATTYYVAANGSDGNNGTSKTTPWLHAPGMAGVSGNPANYSPRPGDSFIFRGGDSWHNTGSPSGLKWTWAWSGSSGNYIYIGGGDQSWSNGSCVNSGIVDTNGATVLLAAYGESTVGTASTPFVAASVWNSAASSWNGGSITINGMSYTIASVQSPYQLTLTTNAGTQRGVSYSNTLWCRPLLNGDLHDISGYTYLTGIGTTYITFDMWEIKGLYLSAANASGPQVSPMSWEALAAVTPYTLSNIFIHGWGHDPFNATTPNAEGWYLMWLNSQGGAFGQGQEIAFWDIDGSDSLDSTFWNGATRATQSCASGNAPYGAPVTLYYPEGKCTSASGIGFEGYNIHDSRFKYLQNGIITNNTHLFYNNIVERIYNAWGTDGSPMHGNAWEYNGEYPATNYIYNNVTRYNNTAVTTWINPYAVDYVFNNVFYMNLAEDFFQCVPGTSNCSLNSSNEHAYYYNNTFAVGSCVGAAGYSTFQNNLWITSNGSSGACPGTSETYGVNFNPTQAVSAGLLVSNALAPTASSPGVGSNLSGSCASISNALCSDTSSGDTKAAVARSSSWNVGAFQTGSASGSGIPPQAPTALTATVQ